MTSHLLCTVFSVISHVVLSLEAFGMQTFCLCEHKLGSRMFQSLRVIKVFNFILFYCFYKKAQCCCFFCLFSIICITIAHFCLNFLQFFKFGSSKLSTDCCGDCFLFARLLGVQEKRLDTDFRSDVWCVCVEICANLSMCTYMEIVCTHMCCVCVCCV